MPRSLSSAILLFFLAAFSSAAQSPDASRPAPPAQAQGSAPPTDARKPKKVWTNENLPAGPGAVSVVGDPKSKAKPAASKPASDAYVASVRKQLEKLQQDIAVVDKLLVDLKSFNAGEPSTSASGTKLNKDRDREPIEVQIRALEEKRKGLESQLAALLDETRKKGIEPGQLR